MRSITKENFTAALEKVVAERGEDYVYPESEMGDGGCVYSNPDGTPSCLIGAALNEIDPDYLQAIKDQNANSAPASMLLGWCGIEDPDLLRAISGAQAEQDMGATWGYALSRYTSELGAR